jgi:DNA polymerase-4
MAALCRDCLTWADPGPRRRCPTCFSPRLLDHPERDELSLAHIDCDAFYAAVEKRDNPALADKPVIIGGGTRGVVSTACYVARIHGVRSAMPMFKALELCPHAVVVRPDMAKYAEVGHQIRTMMLDLTPLVEPVSIDEAFLDLSGTEKLHGAPPAFVLARFAKRVEAEIGVSVSVGLSYAKFLAKLASDAEKPRGFSIIGRKEVMARLAPLAVGALPGIGKVSAERFSAMGYRTIADIQRVEQSFLARQFGEDGFRLWRLAHGIDDRRVEPERDAKSVSAETTFATDIADEDTLLPVLMELCEKVGRRLRQSEVAGRTVVLKLKTKDFKSRTRNQTLPEPTRRAAKLYEIGRELLLRELDGTRFRLLGIGVSDLYDSDDADQGDLVDTKAKRGAELEEAMDRLRAKFGGQAVTRALIMRAPDDDEEEDEASD